jgi:hypothetical protein
MFTVEELEAIGVIIMIQYLKLLNAGKTVMMMV